MKFISKEDVYEISKLSKIRTAAESSNKILTSNTKEMDDAVHTE